MDWKRCWIQCLSFTLLCSQPARAEFKGPPSASSGVIEKEIEDDYKVQPVDPDREAPDLKVDIPEQQLSMEEGVVVFIQKIQLCNNEVLPSLDIDTILASYEGKELSMRQIQEVCIKLQNAYLQKGYFLARVFPPPQEIRDGILLLEVMEGKLGQVIVQGNRFYKASFIEKYFAKFQDRAIHYGSLYKSLLILNENPDLQTKVIFKKGEKVGTADLIVQVEDTRPLHIGLMENNFGSWQSSQWRTSLQASYGNLLFQGDTLSFRQALGNPIRNVNFSQGLYTVPINTIGTSLQGTYGYSRTRSPALEEVGYRGKTNIATAQVGQAFTRTKRTSTDAYFRFEYKQIFNRAQNGNQSYDKLRIAVAGWKVDHTDRLWGRNIADIHLSYGIPHFLGGLHTVDAKCSRGGAGGLFAILSADIHRVQALPKHCLLLMYVKGQAAPYKLPSVEQMYIGGEGTVRGFPRGVFVGDSGYSGTIECRAPIPFLAGKKVPFSKKTWKEFLQVTGFIDQGGVALNGGGAVQRRHVSMMGTGVGLRSYLPYNINISFDVGFPLTKKVRFTKKKKQKSPLYTFQVGLQPF